jgi:hypothetical protein
MQKKFWNTILRVQPMVYRLSKYPQPFMPQDSNTGAEEANPLRLIRPACPNVHIPKALNGL